MPDIREDPHGIVEVFGSMDELDKSREAAIERSAERTAQPLAVFYRALYEVDEHTRSQLTLMYARRIFLGGKSGP